MLFHSCLTCLGEVIEHIAVLLAQRIADGEHALDESATGRTVGAEAGMAPQDAMPQGPFCRVVGGLDALLAHESPQRRFDGSEIGAGSRRLGIGKLLTTPQLEAEPPAQVADVDPETGAFEGAIADSVPPQKQLLGVIDQLVADRGRFPAPFGEVLEGALQMRPADLALRQRQIVIYHVAIGSEPTTAVVCSPKSS